MAEGTLAEWGAKKPPEHHLSRSEKAVGLCSPVRTVHQHKAAVHPSDPKADIHKRHSVWTGEPFMTSRNRVFETDCVLIL